LKQYKLPYGKWEVKFLTGKKAVLLILIVLIPVSGIYIYIQLNKLPTGIKRYSNHDDGISILLNYEKRSPSQLATQIDSLNNEFNASLSYRDINDKTIHEYRNKEGEMLYIGYAWYFTSLSIDSKVVGSILSNIDEIKQYRFSPTDSLNFDENWEDRWTNTGNLNNLTITSGWIIYQKIDQGIVRGRLNGNGELIQSISILSEYSALHFLAMSFRIWMA
jgi:hypothetical protein